MDHMRHAKGSARPTPARRREPLGDEDPEELDFEAPDYEAPDSKKTEADEEALAKGAVVMRPYGRSDGSRKRSHDTSHRWRHVVAAIVVAVVAVVVVGIIYVLWMLANANSKLGDSSLARAVSSSATGTAVATTGVTTSQDSFANVLVLTVDGISRNPQSLVEAHAFVLDTSAQRGYLVTLPITMRVATSDGASTLQLLFSTRQAQGSVSAVTASTGISFDHVVVIDQAGWSKLEGLSTAGATEIVSQMGDLLSSMKTDMSTTDLLSFAEDLRGMGRSSLHKVDAPTAQVVEGDVTYTVVDATQLGLALGTLVAAS